MAGVLEQQGWSVWWDRAIPPGRSFDEVIEEELDSSKCVVVLWSTASVLSHWVKTEATEGLNRNVLVPALIEDVKIPLAFRLLQSARVTDWNGELPHQEIGKLVSAIGTILGYPGVEEKGEEKKATAIPKKKEKRKEEKVTDVELPIFRSTPKEDLSKDSVKAMLKRHNFFCKKPWFEGGTGRYANPGGVGFNNNFEKKNSGQVVYDHASGLMWQQSGSEKNISHDKAKKYVVKLNSDQFAGYSGWRLPTLEEVMSLMAPTKKNGNLYIESVFDKSQTGIWTSDLFDASGTWLNVPCAWVVHFTGGYCENHGLSDNIYVRAVR